MTALHAPLTETPKPPAKPAGAKRASTFGVDLTVSLGVIALAVWLGGIGLNRGFGIHVPFLGAFFLLFAALVVVKTAATAVADTWHATRIKADINLISASLAVQAQQQQQASGGLTALLDSLMKPPAESGGDSPYL